jgi:hypothetical protein
MLPANRESIIVAEAARFSKRSLWATATSISLMASIGEQFQISALGRNIVDAGKQHEARHPWKIASIEDSNGPHSPRLS